MTTLKEIQDAIAEAMTQEKARNLPRVCEKLGLAPGSEDEALQSKKGYVRDRLIELDEAALLDVAAKVKGMYLSPTLEALVSDALMRRNRIPDFTRRELLDELLMMGEINGELGLVDFLGRIWNLEKMPSGDTRFQTAAGDIFQHMVNNEDWDFDYLFDKRLDLLHCPDEEFLKFAEQVVHPRVRDAGEQSRYLTVLNKHLGKVGLQLVIAEKIADRSVYCAQSVGQGASGAVKNLIFASDGPKPEIVLSDALTNDIQIVGNEKSCLVFDRPIPAQGLMWSDLVEWWAALSGGAADADAARGLYRRLLGSLGDSPPEQLVFKAYYEHFKGRPWTKLPALVPQVYLHYDPYTLKQLAGKKRLVRQRMDFLLLFSPAERVVLEVDGKQHYSEDDRASPRLYAEMAAADRDLRLAGYEVYRFGGAELQGAAGTELVVAFFERLFKKHNVAN